MTQTGYATTRKILELVRRAEAGEPLTNQKVQDLCKVDRAAAGRYLKLVREHIGLRPRTRGGRKLWEQPLDPEGVLNRVALLELAGQSLWWLRDTAHLAHLGTVTRELRAQLPPDQQDRLDRLVSAVYFKNPGYASASLSRNVAELIDAIIKRRRCSFNYETLDGTRDSYIVEPWSIAVVGQTICLLSRKVSAGRRRTFDVAAIENLVIEEHTFPSPTRSESNPESLMGDSIGTYAREYGDVTEVRFRVRGRAAAKLRRHPLHRTQILTGGTDGWVDVHLRTLICPDLRAALLALLPDVRIASPPTLADELRAAARALGGSQPDPLDPQ